MTRNTGGAERNGWTAGTIATARAAVVGAGLLIGGIGCAGSPGRSSGVAGPPASEPAAPPTKPTTVRSTPEPETTPMRRSSAVFAEALAAGRGASGNEYLTTIADLDDRAGVLTELLPTAPTAIQEAVGDIAAGLAGIAAATSTIDLDDLVEVESRMVNGHAEPADVARWDRMTDAHAAAVVDNWGDEQFDAVFTIGQHCGLTDLYVERIGDEAWAALFAPGGPLDAFARHGLVGYLCVFGHCGSVTGGLGGLLGLGSNSGMDDEAQQCWDALDAARPGDDRGCDALYEACADGNMAACNDLGENANDGTAYARFGESCGGRDDSPEELYLGICDLLEPS